MFESTKTKSLGGLTVTIAVLGPEECKKVFGLSLFDKGIQPVWVRIENRDDVPYIFQPTSIDVDYFAALEVAYRFYSRFDGDRNRRLDDFFERMAIGRSVEPLHELSGFVFTNVDLGGKHVYAKLVAPGRVREFSLLSSRTRRASRRPREGSLRRALRR